MERSIHTGAFFLNFVWALLLWFVPMGSHGASKTKAAADSDLFKGTNIVRISITIPEKGIQELRRTPWGQAAVGQERPQVKATVSDGERTYNEVALHLKGAAGSFQPIEARPGLTLNFDKFVKGQTFHGIEKLSLNNSRQDPSFIAEKLSRELYLKLGVPVPRSDYALVTLNGRNLGLYVLAEGFNKQFLAQHFKKTGGNLYDGGFCQDIGGAMTVNSGDKPDDWSDLQRLLKAAEVARRNNDLSEVAKVLDMDRFITMTALDVLLCHWDGYALNRNNYRVYSDPESGKMVFMPHGLDQLFGRGKDAPETSINPQLKGIIARQVVGTTEGRKLYLQRLGELKTNVMNPRELVRRVREIEARIQPFVSSRHKAAVNELCQNIVARNENLEHQFNSPIRELKFNSSGFAMVEGWKPRNALSGSQFDKITGPKGQQFLHILGNGSSSSASWRTRVTLLAGRYRFEGMVRSKGTAENGSMVTLRISGAQQVRRVQPDGGWTKTSHDFTVEEPVADVELVCEIRGASGEVWFDADSLQIVRLSKN